jgi:hypothetical protein
MAMMKRELEERVEALAEHMMVVHGNDRLPRTHIEWDRTRDDSQFSMHLEDAMDAVLFLYTNYEN